MPKALAAALLAILLAFTTEPARSADAATPNDTARFLAGLPPAPDSPLAALAADPLWEKHAHYFDSLFNLEESNKLSRIRRFSQTQLPEKHDTLLYTFSGPDFLYASTFFPGASTYVLAGLEPIGDVPQLTNLTHPALDTSLRNVEISLDSLVSFSFFITRKMKTQLQEGPVYGTLPILYVFLARTGKTIHEVSFVSLDAQGNFQNQEQGASKTRTAPRSAAPGVKIVFSDGRGPQQTLYYFSTNLADGSIERSGFLAFCEKLGPTDSFIKSASYLMHTGRFDKVRNFLLDHSATILQDDSGIPLAYFDPAKWRLQPFGHYLGPVDVFGNAYLQPQMRELFRSGNAIPIDFGIGYRWRKNESNLLLAERTAPLTSQGELAPRLPSDRYPAGTDSQSPHKARTAVGVPPARRNRVETESTGSLGCGILGIFPFCSVPQTKSSQ
jgi:hypothetical protein